jgi:hypothetical protein
VAVVRLVEQQILEVAEEEDQEMVTQGHLVHQDRVLVVELLLMQVEVAEEADQAQLVALAMLVLVVLAVLVQLLQLLAHQ